MEFRNQNRNLKTNTPIILAPLKGRMVDVHVERRMVQPASHIFVIVAQKVSV